jgi:hypothetical protein
MPSLVPDGPDDASAQGTGPAHVPPDGYGDPDHDDQSAVTADPPTPPHLPVTSPPEQGAAS